MSMACVDDWRWKRSALIAVIVAVAVAKTMAVEVVVVVVVKVLYVLWRPKKRRRVEPTRYFVIQWQNYINILTVIICNNSYLTDDNNAAETTQPVKRSEPHNRGRIYAYPVRAPYWSHWSARRCVIRSKC